LRGATADAQALHGRERERHRLLPLRGAIFIIIIRLLLIPLDVVFMFSARRRLLRRAAVVVHALRALLRHPPAVVLRERVELRCKSSDLKRGIFSSTKPS